MVARQENLRQVTNESLKCRVFPEYLHRIALCMKRKLYVKTVQYKRFSFFIRVHFVNNSAEYCTLIKTSLLNWTSCSEAPKLRIMTSRDCKAAHCNVRRNQKLFLELLTNNRCTLGIQIQLSQISFTLTFPIHYDCTQQEKKRQRGAVSRKTTQFNAICRIART